ncbi:hypothetical protein, partial [Streptomyces parvus]|uniref:hypothetical protein n=1 Tax=Streptomyces parvus TaxID=66428 RepID=UPI00344CFD10
SEPTAAAEPTKKAAEKPSAAPAAASSDSGPGPGILPGRRPFAVCTGPGQAGCSAVGRCA